MNFNSQITRAEWDEDRGKWKIQVTQKKVDTYEKEQILVLEELCDVFLYATGALNGAKWPDVEGVEQFKGKLIHSFVWPDNYRKEQWANERVAVIGAGASGLQIVSSMKPFAKSIDIFIRTGTWFSRMADNFGEYKPYSEEERERFRQDGESLVSHAKDIEEQLSSCLDLQIAGSEAQEMASNWTRDHMREHLKDDRLYYGFLPSFGLGCRRNTPADPYMKAIQESNVSIHFTAASRLTSGSIIDAHGTSTFIDIIICASGFDTSYRPRFPIIGRGGIDLAQKMVSPPRSLPRHHRPRHAQFLHVHGALLACS
jgi:hydroxyversicolorone monooxygenase